MPYRSSHVAKLFEVSHETVRSWSSEFEEYLSPLANPGKGKQRMYSDDDMAVFALVSDMRGNNMNFSEIHIALKDGQRGQPPLVPPEQVQALLTSDQETLLGKRVGELESELIKAQNALQIAQKDLQAMQDLKETNIRLEAQLEGSTKREKELQAKVDELMKRVEEISKDSGREYAKGFKEGFQQHQQLSDDE